MPLFKNPNNPPTSQDVVLDPRHKAVAEIIAGLSQEEDRSVEFVAIVGAEGTSEYPAPPKITHSTLIRFKGMFGGDSPNLFPDMTTYELSISEAQRTTTVHDFHEMNWQGNEGAWAGQSNSSL